MTRWQKPGRFGHIPMDLCECPRTTVDSRSMVVVPVSLSRTGAWSVVECQECGGTAAMVVSLIQHRVDLCPVKKAPGVRKLFVNVTQEPPMPSTEKPGEG